jgi:hypothetical protein
MALAPDFNNCVSETPRSSTGDFSFIFLLVLVRYCHYELVFPPKRLVPPKHFAEMSEENNSPIFRQIKLCQYNVYNNINEN